MMVDHAKFDDGYHSFPAQLRRMPFWDQPTPALANWRKTLGEAISLNENRPAVNRAVLRVLF
jgi:hypothetical protein